MGWVGLVLGQYAALSKKEKRNTNCKNQINDIWHVFNCNPGVLYMEPTTGEMCGEEKECVVMMVFYGAS